jgi:hypothetical protein
MAEPHDLLACLEDARDALLQHHVGWETSAQACAELLRAEARRHGDRNLASCADMLGEASKTKGPALHAGLLEALRIGVEVVRASKRNE